MVFLPLTFKVGEISKNGDERLAKRAEARIAICSTRNTAQRHGQQSGELTRHTTSVSAPGSPFPAYHPTTLLFYVFVLLYVGK
jgi:hypothetical protein